MSSLASSINGATDGNAFCSSLFCEVSHFPNYKPKFKKSENSQAVFAKAILKDWSEQHEYELGKLTISLLKDSKNQRSDTLELVKLITQMAEKEQIWQEQKVTVFHKYFIPK